MGISVQLWRARIGGFSGKRYKERLRIGRITLGSRHGLFTNFIVATMIVLTLCGDIELNPGPDPDPAPGQVTQGQNEQRNNFSETYMQPVTAQDYASYYGALHHAQGLSLAPEYQSSLYQLLDTRLSKIDEKMEKIYKQQLDTDSKITNLQKGMQEIKKRQDNMEQNLEQTKREIQNNNHQTAQTWSRVEALDRRLIQNNIRIFNLKTEDAKTEPEVKEKFIVFAKQYLGVEVSVNEINRTYFSGKGKGKHVVIEFVLRQSKYNIMSSLKNLRTTDPESKFSVCDDLTPFELGNRKAKLPLFKQLKSKAGPNDTVQLRRGDIYVNKVLQSEESANELLRGPVGSTTEPTRQGWNGARPRTQNLGPYRGPQNDPNA